MDINTNFDKALDGGKILRIDTVKIFNYHTLHK